MASAMSLIVAQKIPAARPSHPAAERNQATAAFATRRRCLLLLTATTALKATEAPAGARDIPLFGLKPGLQAAEKEAELIVKEGFEAAEKGLEAAEIGIEAAEKSVEVAEKEIEATVSFGGLSQAGTVVAAEAVGILVATSVVNGILGPEP